MKQLFSWLGVVVVGGALCANVAAGEGKVLKVFVLAGQSNMDGRGDPAELPKELQAPQTKVLAFTGKDWVPVAPGKKIGPEVSFAARLATEMGEPAGIIKLGSSGTSLAKDWDPKIPTSLYNILANRVKAAQKSRKIEIVGMIWMQGESDCSYEAMAKAYAANLEQLIKTARKDFGSPDMVFVAGRVNPPEGQFKFVGDVRKAQAGCKLPGYDYVDCDKLDKKPDKLHYNTKGQVELGTIFADKVLNMLKKPAAPVDIRKAIEEAV